MVYGAIAAGVYSHNRKNRSAGQDQYAQAFQQFGLANPYGDARYDPRTAGGSANYWDYDRDESGVYD